jgi:cell division protein FtsX
MYWRPYKAPEPSEPGSTTKERSILPTAFAALIFSALSALFFSAYYHWYFKWEFNELGRYYDEETMSVYTTAGAIWIVPAIIFLIPALMLIVVTLKRIREKRRPGRNPDDA